MIQSQNNDNHETRSRVIALIEDVESNGSAVDLRKPVPPSQHSRNPSYDLPPTLMRTPSLLSLAGDESSSIASSVSEFSSSWRVGGVNNDEAGGYFAFLQSALKIHAAGGKLMPIESDNARQSIAPPRISHARNISDCTVLTTSCGYLSLSDHESIDVFLPSKKGDGAAASNPVSAAPRRMDKAPSSPVRQMSDAGDAERKKPSIMGMHGPIRLAGTSTLAVKEQSGPKYPRRKLSMEGLEELQQVVVLPGSPQPPSLWPLAAQQEPTTVAARLITGSRSVAPRMPNRKASVDMAADAASHGIFVMPLAVIAEQPPQKTVMDRSN